MAAMVKSDSVQNIQNAFCEKTTLGGPGSKKIVLKYKNMPDYGSIV